jgi:hypothetical protein
VDGHEVIGLSPGIWKTFLKEVVKRFHLLQASILSRPDFAEIAAQIHESQIPFVKTSFVPSEDLVDLAKDKYSSFKIEGADYRNSSSTVPVGRNSRLSTSGNSRNPYFL